MRCDWKARDKMREDKKNGLNIQMARRETQNDATASGDLSQSLSINDCL